MKLDIVRAWKDEKYRQNLSNEQRDMLPANPAGDLTEAEMRSVYGGGGGGGFPVIGGGGGGGLGGGGLGGGGVSSLHHQSVHHHGAGAGSTAASASALALSSFEDNHWHSLSIAACETNVFSAAQTVAPVAPLLSPVTVICSSVS